MGVHSITGANHWPSVLALERFVIFLSCHHELYFKRIEFGTSRPVKDEFTSCFWTCHNVIKEGIFEPARFTSCFGMIREFEPRSGVRCS